MRKKILVVEDNKRVLEILAFALGREGYVVLRASDGLAGVQLAEKQSPDLIILDLTVPISEKELPTMCNLEFCRCLQEENISAPVLALITTDKEKVELSAAGADDFVMKPFAMQELLLRLKASTWHVDSLPDRPDTARLHVLGRIAIDPDQALVMKDGVVVDLTRREYDLISYLAKEPGIVFAREDIMRYVWDYTGYVGDVRAVDVSIRRLREKIEDDPANPTIIMTKRGRGYFISRT